MSRAVTVAQHYARLDREAREDTLPRLPDDAEPGPVGRQYQILHWYTDTGRHRGDARNATIYRWVDAGRTADPHAAYAVLAFTPFGMWIILL